MYEIIHYRQGDYPKVRLGSCGKISIKTSGCFITSLAMLANIDPVEVNRRLVNIGAYTSCNMLTYKIKTAKELKLGYGGRHYSKSEAMKTLKNMKKDLCIAETRDNAKQGIPQHFFVYNTKTGEMSDPLSSFRGWEKCKYSIASYRTFVMSDEKQEAIEVEGRVVPEPNERELLPVNKDASIAENLLETLQVAKELYEKSDIADDQNGRVIASQLGRYLREIADDLGVDISK